MSGCVAVRFYPGESFKPEYAVFRDHYDILFNKSSDKICGEQNPTRITSQMDMLGKCNFECMTIVREDKFCAICENHTPSNLKRNDDAGALKNKQSSLAEMCSGKSFTYKEVNFIYLFCVIYLVCDVDRVEGSEEFQQNITKFFNEKGLSWCIAVLSLNAKV